MAAVAVLSELSTTPPAATLGLAHLAGMVFAGADLDPLFNALLARAGASPPDAGAMLDVSAMLQLVGQRDQGLAIQADALNLARHYRHAHGGGDGSTILALVTPGDFMANTPADFLLKGSHFKLDFLFLDAGKPLPSPLPEHDLAILGVGESDENAPLLRALEPILAAWPRPILNRRSGQVIALGRDRAPEILKGTPGLLSPPTVRANQTDVVAQAAAIGFPLIVRPVGSHAGAGLEKVDSAEALADYLTRCAAPTYYLQPFIDYSGADGLFRKLRVALIGGRPFCAHMAVSQNWMVHYLNAGMAEDAGKRAEEAAMMASFDEGFAARHAGAFAALCERIGLDYFAVDCGETRDGDLLIFEADTAMIIHDMDPPDLYPYKGPAMAKLFAAFQALLTRSIARI